MFLYWLIDRYSVFVFYFDFNSYIYVVFLQSWIKVFLIFGRLFKGSVYKGNREFLAGVLGGIFYTKPGSAILPSCKKDRLRFMKLFFLFFPHNTSGKTPQTHGTRTKEYPVSCARTLFTFVLRCKYFTQYNSKLTSLPSVVVLKTQIIHNDSTYLFLFLA